MCEICRIYPCHSKCPNYVPLKTTYYCSICNQGIYDGEEYVMNCDREYAHYDCLDNMSFSDALEWTGCEVRTMEDEEY
jgi:hypothetical protein